MEQVFVWRKAVIGSLGFHIIAAVALGVIGYHMSQMAAARRMKLIYRFLWRRKRL